MVDREQVLAAIAAQEQLRGSVPDDVVDLAVATLRAQLAPERAERRGQATVLFADVAGFTSLSEGMDAELVARLMNQLWFTVDDAIERSGGRVDKHIGDAVMGVWGVDRVREDDPERAVRAALDLRDAFERFKAAHGLDIDVRVGVNTGPVLFGDVGTAGEHTVTGDAVNVASRVEGLAPHGHVLVSHDTYRHVRGIFDVRPLEPAVVKGKAEPLRTYLVQRAKVRAFHLRTRGVEGIATSMVGREGELGALQAAFVEAVAGPTTRVVTVVGDAGAGKSRLLDEFANWLDLRPEEVLYLKGRSVPDLQIVPRGLLRELFAYRFEILDDDPRPTVAAKLRSGLAPLARREAELVGEWLGFETGASDVGDGLAGSPDFGIVAESMLIRYLRAAVADGPSVVLLEDLHWADGDSLDTIGHIVEQIPGGPLLIVAVARPSLDRRRQGWGAGPGSARRLELQPLVDDDARALVGEILARVAHLPAALVDLVVAQADGNPFYVEELVKTLVEEDVLQTDRPDGTWTVDLSRLERLSVPPTLAGVLQARLDALPADERTAVQHASVIGRTFWDDAVGALFTTTGRDGSDAGATLDRVRERELVWRNEKSSFSGCAEFRFKHALLRDAAYETVLLRARAPLHAAAAAWMERRAAERLEEHLAPIADHLALAGDHGRAASLFERAADKAANTGGVGAAVSMYRRCLDCLEQAGEEHGRDAIRVRVGLGANLMLDDRYDEAVGVLALADVDASVLGDPALRALAGGQLARVALARGEVAEAERRVRPALPLAEAEGGRVLAEVLLVQAWLLDVTDRQAAAVAPALRALEASRAAGHAELEIRAHNQISTSLSRLGRFDEAVEHLDAALTVCRRIGNPVREAMILSTWGALEHIRASAEGGPGLSRAIELYTRSYEVSGEVGLESGRFGVVVNLAQAQVESGLLDEGVANARKGLQGAWERGQAPVVAFAVVVLGQARIAAGDRDGGLAMIGTGVADPRAEGSTDELARILGIYGIDPRDAAPLLDAGATGTLEAVVADLLNADSGLA